METIYVLTEIRTGWGSPSFGVLAVSSNVSKLRDKMYERIGVDMLLDDEQRDEEIEGNGYGDWMNDEKTIFEGYMDGGDMYTLEIEKIPYLK